MDGDDDHDLLRLYRRQENGLPPATLDARILAASRAHDKRRWFVVLAAAAIAAALIPTIPPLRHESRPTASATAGLYDGLVSQQLANPQLMRQMAIMQLPGGSDGGKANGL